MLFFQPQSLFSAPAAPCAGGGKGNRAVNRFFPLGKIARLNTSAALLGVLFAWAVLPLHADDLTWSGGDGDWSAAASWLPDGRRSPEIASGMDSATVASGAVAYVPDGKSDWINNSRVTIEKGGGWTQAGESINWIRIGNGAAHARRLLVTGGTFEAGHSEMVVVGCDGGRGTLAVSAGGSLTARGLLIQSGTMSVLDKDSSVSVSGELQLRGNGVVASVSGGTLNVGLFSLNDSDAGAGTVVAFSAGRINVTAEELKFDGIYTENNNVYLDFTGKASGVLFLKHGLSENARKLLLEGRVRLNGAAAPGAFSINETSDGVEISVR